MTEAIAKTLKKPLWLPAVPGFVLKLVLGEMATLVTTGSKVSPEKIQKAGFVFQFNELEDALSDLFGLH
jgi:NAD dependent epimerase/dehydratase family enzyme